MKTSTRQLALLVSLLLFLSLPTAYAQYNYWDAKDGLAIRQGDHIALGMSSMADDGAGNFLMAWTEATLGTMDVHAQLYNFAGEPQWDNDGIVVAETQLPDQDSKVVRTSDGNWIIAWHDFAEDVFMNGIGQIYLQKYNDQGQALWSHPVGPTGECYSYQGRWKLLADQNGGVFVLAQESGQMSIYYIASDGTESWGHPISLENHQYTYLQAELATDGGLIVVTSSYIMDNSYVGVQKILPNGHLLWTGNPGGLLLVQGDEVSVTKPLNPMPLSNGDFVIGWVNYSSGVAKGVKISSTGEMLWDEQPVVLATDLGTAYQYENPVLVGDCVLISDGYEFRRFRLIDCSGDRPAEVWVTDSIDAEYFNELQTKVLPDGTIWVSWADGDMQLISAKIDTEGNWVWTNPQYVGTWNNLYHFNLYQYGTEVATVWNYRDGDATGIGFQVQDVSTGNKIHSEPLFLQSGVSGDTWSPVICRNGEMAFVGWHDRRFNGDCYPCYQVVTWDTGDYGLTRNGVPLVDIAEEEGFRNSNLLQVFPDGEGGAVYFWVEDNSFVERMRGQRIDAQGNRLWGDEGVKFFDRGDEMYFINEYAVTLTEDGNIVIAALEAQCQNDRFPHASFLILDMDGNLVSDGIVSPYEDDESIHQYLKLLVDGDGDIYLSFSMSNGGYNFGIVQYARFHPNGEMLWSQTVEFERMAWCQDWVLLEEEHELVCLIDVDNSWEGETLSVQRLTTDGNWLSEPQGTVLIDRDNSFCALAAVEPADGDVTIVGCTLDESVYYHFTKEGLSYPDIEEGVVIAEESWGENILLDPSGGAYIFFERYAIGFSDLYFVHVAPDGEFVSDQYTTVGKPIVTAIFDQRQIQVAPDQEGGFVAVWNDWRGSFMAEPEDDVYAYRFNDYVMSDVRGEEENLPSQYVLEPAYPNPFNPSTTLRYVVPRAGKVRLAVYDILGREVARLVDGMQSPGQHRIVWNAQSGSGASLATGAYFIRFDTPSGSQVQRVLLLK